MDPAILSAAVVRLLVPYLRRLAEKTGDNVTDAAAGGMLATGKRLYESLRARFKNSSYADSQLTGVAERPESDSRREALRGGLEEMFAEDPQFKALIERVVEDALRANAGGTTVQDAGAVAGGDITIRGRYAAGRDISIDRERN